MTSRPASVSLPLAVRLLGPTRVQERDWMASLSPDVLKWHGLCPDGDAGDHRLISMAGNCRCTLLALRMLVRVEELTTTPQAPLETALQLTEEAETHSLAVLSCDACRQHRLPLTAVTILSTRLADWLRRSWRLADDDNDDDYDDDNANDTNDTNNSNAPPARSRKFSLGGYDLDADEADVLGHELMTQRLTRFSAVLGSLEAALLGCSIASSPSSLSPDGGRPGVPTCLDLVRSQLCLLRACIRRLKARSLLNGATTGYDMHLSDRPSAQALW